MSKLDNQTFHKIVNFLIPHCVGSRERTALIHAALHECRVLDQINWDGDARTFTIHLVNTLLRFGYCADEPAIVTLLEHLRNQVGFDQQAQIDGILNEIPSEEIDVSQIDDWQLPDISQKNHIFIAYSNQNLEIVRRITTDLLNSGINIWVAHIGLQIGERDWEETIRGAIEDADAVLYMASPDARKSDYVRDELSIAKGYNKTIYSLWIAGQRWHDATPLGSGTMQHIDLRGKLYEQNLYRIIRALKGDAKVYQPPQDSVDKQSPKSSNRTLMYVIIGIVSILVLFAAISLFLTTRDNNRATTPTLQAMTAVAMGVETEEVIPTQTPTPTETPDLAVQQASSKMNSNADWQVLYPNGFVQNFDNVEMVLVPMGCFDMGYDGGDRDEIPITPICFDTPFWIDRYEVSNEQFIEFGGKAKNSSSWTDIPNRPRESITWFEARDYCVLRGGQLPTEAEWEFAARGPDSLKYPWGDQFESDNLVYRENSDFRTARISSREGGISWVGTHDMSGNVWEWVSSIYYDYPYDPVDGRENLEIFTVTRVRRGGSYYNSANFLERTGVAERQADEPSIYNDDLGFRCARAFE